jgi:enterochelin esterase family protein
MTLQTASLPTLARLAAALALLSGPFVLRAQPAAPTAALPGLDTFKAALTLNDTQAAQIAPLLTTDAEAFYALTAAQQRATAARADANTKIIAILNDAQKLQFATLTAPPAARGGGRGGGAMTDAERAEIAKLSELPQWKPGAGDGDYRIGPDYPAAPEVLHPLKPGVAMPTIVPAPVAGRGAPAPERTKLPAGQMYSDEVGDFARANSAIPVGRVESFSLPLAESKFYPGTARNAAAARNITVYIPAQYVPGTPAPLIVTADAYGAPGYGWGSKALPAILDNMIAAKRVPASIAIMIFNGGGDGPGSERGLEYDTVSGKYAEFVEAEILPKVEKDYNVRLTKDPQGRVTIGGSSGGIAAFSMAWFHPELYGRVIAWSCTLVNQQSGPDAPHGGWSYHETIIPQSPVKPIRFWLQVGQNDNGSTSPATGYRNWLLSNVRTAAVLKEKGYHYQFLYGLNAGHTPGNVINNTFPQALEWAWQGYTPVTR